MFLTRLDSYSLTLMTTEISQCDVLIMFIPSYRTLKKPQCEPCFKSVKSRWGKILQPMPLNKEKPAFHSEIQTALTLNVLFPCRSSTKSTTPPGIASWGGILAATWLTRPNISSTSTWVRWPSCSSNQAERRHPFITNWLYWRGAGTCLPSLGCFSFRSDYCLEKPMWGEMP